LIALGFRQADRHLRGHRHRAGPAGRESARGLVYAATAAGDARAGRCSSRPRRLVLDVHLKLHQATPSAKRPSPTCVPHAAVALAALLALILATAAFLLAQAPATDASCGRGPGRRDRGAGWFATQWATAMLHSRHLLSAFATAVLVAATRAVAWTERVGRVGWPSRRLCFSGAESATSSPRRCAAAAPAIFLGCPGRPSRRRSRARAEPAERTAHAPYFRAARLAGPALHPFHTYTLSAGKQPFSIAWACTMSRPRWGPKGLDSHRRHALRMARLEFFRRVAEPGSSHRCSRVSEGVDSDACSRRADLTQFAVSAPIQYLSGKV